MGEHITSEEKLLRLIRKKDKAAAPANRPAQGMDARGAGRKSEERPVGKDSLALWNRILVILIIGIWAVILARYFSEEKHRSMNPRSALVDSLDSAGKDTPDSTRQSPAWRAPLGVVEAKPFEFYAGKIEGRDVFEAPWEKPALDSQAPADPALGLSKRLKVVGILLDEDPKAIIEDLETKQTFFLSPKERMGDIVVDEIREDKVIVIFNEEKVELTP